MKRLLTFFLLFSLSHAFAMKANYLVIVDQAEPFQIVDQKGNHTGIFTEFIDEIFRGSEYELNKNAYPIQRLKQVISKSMIKNWIAFGAAEWGYPQKLNLTSCRLHQAKHVILRLNQEKVRVKSVKDLYDRQLALLFGFDYPSLDDHIKSKKIDSVRPQSYSSAFTLVDIKRAYGFIEMEARIRYNLKKNKKDFKQYNLENISHIIPPYSIYLTLDPKMDKKLKQFILRRCDELSKGQYIRYLLSKYTN